MDAVPRQIAVYRKYLHLQSTAQERFSGTLAGRMVLSAGFGLPGSEWALATTIAGGVFLGIDPGPLALKAAVQSGACDFMVTTLDEALRVMKNELRKHTPLAAGLLGATLETLQAMVERGVQPDLIVDAISPGTTGESCRPALRPFEQRGAAILAEAALTPDRAAAETVWTAANRQDLRRMDRIALDLLPEEDRIRRRWLEQAAGCFDRRKPLERVLGLLPQERQNFIDALQRENSSSAFEMPASVHWQDADGREQSATL